MRMRDASRMLTMTVLVLAAFLIVGCSKSVSNPGGTPDTNIPAPPTNIRCTVIGDSMISLAWQDNSTNEDGFEIQQSVGLVLNFTTLLATEADVVSAPVGDLSPDSVYYFRVRAFNSHGASEFTPSIRFTFGSPVVSLMRVLGPPLEGPALCVTFDCDSRYVLSGWGDYNARSWLVSDGSLTRTYTGNTNLVQSIASSPVSKYFATASTDGYVRIWNLSAPGIHAQLDQTNGRPNSIAYSPVTGNLAVAGANSVVIWNTEQDVIVKSLHDTLAPGCLAYSPKGERLAVSYGEYIYVWMVDDSLVVSKIYASANCLAFSPDGEQLAIASGDSIIQVWNPSASPCKIADLIGHHGPVYAVEFNPDGRYIASASWDYSVIIWNAQDFRPLQQLSGHDYCVYDLAFSPDGRYLASASGDRTIGIWGPFN